MRHNMAAEAMMQTAQPMPRVSGKGAIQYLRPTLSRNELKSVLESLVMEEVTFGQGVVNFERAFARTFDFQHAAAVIRILRPFTLHCWRQRWKKTMRLWCRFRRRSVF